MVLLDKLIGVAPQSRAQLDRSGLPSLPTGRQAKP
jgi:hypothetical protein